MAVEQRFQVQGTILAQKGEQLQEKYIHWAVWFRILELRAAPDAVLDALGSVLWRMAVTLTGPADNFMVLLHLIPKKSTKPTPQFRTAATYPSYWRLLMTVTADSLREHENSKGHDFDTTLAGRRPHIVILTRQLNAAVAQSLGEAWAAVLWDVDALYESCFRTQGCIRG